MNGGTMGFFGARPVRFFRTLSPPAIVFSLLCLLWGLFSGTEAYANVEYGFSALAALGAAGCLGHLAAYAYRNSARLSAAFFVLGGVGLVEARRTGGLLTPNAEWPLLVALLFGPFVLLLAGLGGWV